MTRPTKLQWLLDDLCSRLGFCLRPEERTRLELAPPEDIDAFANEVLAAEGMDPHDKANRALRGQVLELVAKHLNPQEGRNAV